MQLKGELRRTLRRQRLNLSPSARQLAEARVRKLIKPWLRRNKRVGIYLAAGSELNINAVLQDALKQGCHLFAPFIEKGQRRLWFTPYPPRSQKSARLFNIIQYEGKKCRIEHLDIVLMPLVGIDKNGMRLGQGGGFYDTSLSYCRHKQPLRIGIGFSVQQSEQAIPHEAHDQALDGFICETGMQRFSRRLQPRY